MATFLCCAAAVLVILAIAAVCFVCALSDLQLRTDHDEIDAPNFGDE